MAEAPAVASNAPATLLRPAAYNVSMNRPMNNTNLTAFDKKPLINWSCEVLAIFF